MSDEPYYSPNDHLRDVDTFTDYQLFALQRYLITNPDARARFNDEWRAMYAGRKEKGLDATGSDLMRDCIREVRNRMLGRNRNAD